MNRKRYRESEITCWSDEWKRTDPDIVVYLPEGEDSCDAHNEHFLVVPTPRMVRFTLEKICFNLASKRDTAATGSTLVRP